MPDSTRFLRHDDSTFGQKILGVSEAQAETMVNDRAAHLGGGQAATTEFVKDIRSIRSQRESDLTDRQRGKKKTYSSRIRLRIGQALKACGAFLTERLRSTAKK